MEMTEGLEALGELLTNRNLTFDIVVVGGGALLLHDLVDRPTQDMDVVALVKGGRWTSPKTLPAEFVDAVREVAAALDLPREPRDAKDWLNTGPVFLRKLGLPDGFRRRAELRTFGNLKVRLAARADLITLKLWAATDSKRGARRKVDIEDVIKMSPSVAEIRDAVAWCAQKDGRPEFAEVEARPVLDALGFGLEEVLDD